jgi:hypothetical protein
MPTTEDINNQQLTSSIDTSISHQEAHLLPERHGPTDGSNLSEFVPISLNDGVGMDNFDDAVSDGVPPPRYVEPGGNGHLDMDPRAEW